MSRTTPAAVKEGTSDEELLALVRQLMAAGVEVVLHCIEERVRLVVSGATDVLFDSSLKCARVHLPSGVLLVLEAAALDELDLDNEMKAEHRCSQYRIRLKPVCSRV